MKNLLILILLLPFVFPICEFYLYPNAAAFNATYNISVSPAFAGHNLSYIFYAIGYNYSNLSKAVNYLVLSTPNATGFLILPNSTRLNVSVYSSNISVFICNKEFYINAKKYSDSPEIFSSILTTFIQSNIHLMLPIFAFGMSYILAFRVGYSAMLAGLTFAAMFIVMHTAIYFYAAIFLIMLGLLLNYAQM